MYKTLREIPSQGGLWISHKGNNWKMVLSPRQQEFFDALMSFVQLGQSPCDCSILFFLRLAYITLFFVSFTFASVQSLFLLPYFFLRFYLFIHETHTHTHTEAETQAEGEAGSMQGARRGAGSQDPWDYTLGRRQELNCWGLGLPYNPVLTDVTILL